MSSVAFINGRIYVSFKPLEIVSGIVVENGRVVFTGFSEKVLEVARVLGIPVVDLRGKIAIPGFVDAHLHVDALGLALHSLDLRGVKSIGELVERVREYLTSARTRWILGHGWDHELFEEKRWPTRWDLDKIVRDRPVLLTRICLHAGVVNTAALEETGVGDFYPEYVVKDDHDVPTGVILESALKYVREHVKKSMSIQDYAELIMKAQEHLLASGVTTIGVAGCNLKTLKALFELRNRGRLKARFRVYLYAYDENEPLYDLLRKLGIKVGFGDEYLKVMGVKLFIDGSLGARTAWLSKPYSDDPTTEGKPVMAPEEIVKVAKTVDEAGLQLAIHAIGDKAVENALSTYRELDKLRVLRHRVEHASLVRDDVLEEMACLKPVVVVQPRFVISDWWAVNRVGRVRARWLYRFRSMLEREIPLALSTDAPVESVNPWETVYAAITRGKYENIPTYNFTEHESLSVLDTLHLYTSGSAYALHSESEVGKLKPGMFADFVVVDKNPLEVSPQELKSIRVLEVYVGGEKVWHA